MTTRYADCSEIMISDKRQRRAFDEGKHVELCDSIQNPAIGMMHPIVLRMREGKKVLVAGERRLRAAKDSHDLGVIFFHAGEPVPPGKIPYTDLGEMDPLDAWEAELEENVRRVDLSWQEKAAATQELMELRQAQAEKKGLPPPSVANIAQEVTGKSEGGYHTRTRQELVVAKHLTDPDVAGAANLDKAVKVIRKKEEQRRNEKLAAEIGTVSTTERHQLFHADSEIWLKTCPDLVYDVILTDPPYGMGADEFGDSGGMAEGPHGYADSAETLMRILAWLPNELFRVTKTQAHAYVFCDFAWFRDISRAMEGAGWKVFRTPLIWYKPAGFRAPWPDMGPQRRYECFVYANKGDKPTQRMGGDVLMFANDDNLGHAAQKPVALYQEILSRSVIPGDSVLDLFCGSGPIFPAAHALKCRATGVEKAADAFAIASKRLKDL